MVRQGVVAFKGDANVLAVGVPVRVAVVLDVAGDGGVDGVVAAKNGVFAGVPDRASLLVDDRSGEDILFWRGKRESVKT